MRYYDTENLDLSIRIINLCYFHILDLGTYRIKAMIDMKEVKIEECCGKPPTISCGDGDGPIKIQCKECNNAIVSGDWGIVWDWNEGCVRRKDK